MKKKKIFFVNIVFESDWRRVIVWSNRKEWIRKAKISSRRTLCIFSYVILMGYIVDKLSPTVQKKPFWECMRQVRFSAPKDGNEWQCSSGASVGCCRCKNRGYPSRNYAKYLAFSLRSLGEVLPYDPVYCWEYPAQSQIYIASSSEKVAIRKSTPT